MRSCVNYARFTIDAKPMHGFIHCKRLQSMFPFPITTAVLLIFLDTNRENDSLTENGEALEGSYSETGNKYVFCLIIFLLIANTKR